MEAAQAVAAVLPRLATPVQAPHVTLAALVPEFPRIGGQVVRDWIGAAAEQLDGFNGDDLTRLLFPDLVDLVDGEGLRVVQQALVSWLQERCYVSPPGLVCVCVLQRA